MTGDPGPGPGNYYPDTGLPGGKLFATRTARFGSSSRYQGRDPATPGPTDYGVPKDPGAKASPKTTFHGSTPKDSRDKYPGPGAYNPGKADKVVHPNPPAIAISWKHEDPGFKEHRPGPLVRACYSKRHGSLREATAP